MELKIPLLKLIEVLSRKFQLQVMREQLKWPEDHQSSQILNTHKNTLPLSYNIYVHMCVMVVLIFIILIINTGCINL